MLSSAFRHARRAAPALSTKGAIRCLNVHEYASMEILQQHGIQTPECYVATTPEEAEEIYSKKMNKGELNAVVGTEVRVCICYLALPDPAYGMRPC